MKLAQAITSGVAGAMLVVAAFRFSYLNWIVDGPGWLVSRFTSIDFHEGEGAFGFLIAIFLAWLACSVAAWLVGDLVRRVAGRASRKHGRA